MSTAPRPPDDAGGLVDAWRAGHALQAAGKLAEAHACYASILAQDPLHAAASVQAALVLRRMGRVRAASSEALRGASLAGPDPMLVVPLARLLRDFHQPFALEGLCDRSYPESWTDPDALFAVARCLATSGMHARADALVGHALRLAPRHVAALYLRAAIAAFDGRASDARAGFGECLALAPRLAQAHWMLSVVDRTSAPAVEERLSELLHARGTAPADRAYLGYALHNRLHVAGRHDAAWEALEIGARAKRSASTYAGDSQRAVFAALKAAVPFRAPQRASRPRPASAPRPVFILGLHRSGTSLLERMLDGHPAVTAGGESYSVSTALKLAADHASSALVDVALVSKLGGVDADDVASRLREALAWRAGGRPFVTEKLPGNFQLLGYILGALPEALVLHMVRDPVDTCFSNLRTYFDEAAPYSYHQREMADFHAGYVDLMRHWHAHWPGRILDIRYESLVASPEPVIRGVLAHCGLAFDPRVLDVARPGGSVSTASMMEVRDGIRLDRSAAWRPYARHLGPLLESLKDSPG